MTTITVFEAADGSRFDEAKKCEEYELLCAEVNRIMAPLDDVDISGPKFYQHSPKAAQSVAHAFTALAVRRLAPSRINEDWHPQGIIQRFIGDGGSNCLRRASSRIACIDLDTGREYEQPYYRIHPNEANTEI